MTVDIVEIERRNYVSKTVEMESLKEYYEMTRKILLSLVGINKFSMGIVSHIIKNEDALSNIVTEVMLGDWQWDKNNVKKMTKFSYRKQNVVFNVYKYVHRYRKTREKIEILRNLPTKIQSYNQENYVLTKKIMDDKELTKRDKKFLDLHYLQGWSQAEIGKTCNLSRERVRQIIDRSLKNLEERYADWR